jgi:glyoxylase-like metal-dependent hydrolase (beta-lactamase superfamily II)
MQTTAKLSRRGLLGSVPALGGLALLGGASSLQAASMETPSLRAIHRFHIGAMKVAIIDDARFTFPAPMFAANQPEGAIVPFLEKYGLPTETVSLHMQITFVETGPHKVLLDTGMGDITFPSNEADNGRLLAGLKTVGVSPEDITDVILSHGHPDHIGSCSTNGEPLFKNARYHLPPNELEFWTQTPGDEQSFMNMMLAVGTAQLEPVRSLIHPYAADDEIVPGITAVAAPGHTLGHHAFLLHDGNDKLLHLMDAAVHYLVGPEEPDWALAVEMDQTAAADTRRTLFRQAAEQNLHVAGYHFPFPGIGKIVSHQNAWRFVPMQTA